MEALRTPDDRFAALADFPFAPHYVEVDDGEGGQLRVHHLDEGDANAPVVLLMHGEPSWSFLYRKMIPVLVDAGLRCVAPDLVGFGRSDKPVKRTDYTYARHVEWMRIGVVRRARPARRHAGRPGLGRAHRVADRRRASLTGSRASSPRTPSLPTGDTPAGDAFMRWQRFSQEVEDFDVGFIVGSGCVRTSRPTSSPDTTRRSPTIRTRPARASSAARSHCARRSRLGGEPEGVGDTARGRSRSSPRSPTRIRSPAAATACSSATCRAAPANRTRRSKAAATSSKKIGASSSRVWSRIGCNAK